MEHELRRGKERHLQMKVQRDFLEAAPEQEHVIAEQTVDVPALQPVEEIDEAAKPLPLERIKARIVEQSGAALCSNEWVAPEQPRSPGAAT